MAIAAGTSNLFFNRDTKVFAGQSLGAALSLPATGISGAYAITTTYAHGMSTGDRVVFTDITNLTGITAATVYYAINASATTFKIATTLANAVAGTAVVCSGTPSAGTTFAYCPDRYVTPTSVTPGSNVIVVASTTAMFKVGDVVAMNNVSPTSDTANLSYSGVYYVAAATPGTSFTITAAGATATGAFTAPTQVQFVKMNLWEIPVLSGYSMAQSMQTSEITLNEMTTAAGVSRRGRQMFNDAQSPTEWSFDTYVRPYKSTNHYAVEEPLWATMIGNNLGVVTGTGSSATTSWALGTTRNSTSLVFDFNSSNSVVLGKLDLYFILGANKVTGRNYTITDAGSTVIYRVGEAVVNEASISFDIDGISTISWSGMGQSAKEIGYFYGTDAASGGTNLTNNFIRNRLTALTAVSTTPTSTTYDITLTGGQITINNNISYLTPEVLGVVNVPLTHVTGTRTVSGNFTAYLDEVSNGTTDLFQNLAEVGYATVTNTFALDFYVGGYTSNDLPTAPGIQFTFDNAHVEVPAINMDDVISVEANFHGLPTTVGGTDEITAVRYVGTT